MFDDNEIPFFQDMQFFRNLPTDVDFEVLPLRGQDGWTLKAPGYGGKPYGNGAIFLLRSQAGKYAEKLDKRLDVLVARPEPDKRDVEIEALKAEVEKTWELLRNQIHISDTLSKEVVRLKKAVEVQQVVDRGAS